MDQAVLLLSRQEVEGTIADDTMERMAASTHEVIGALLYCKVNDPGALGDHIWISNTQCDIKERWEIDDPPLTLHNKDQKLLSSDLPFDIDRRSIQPRICKVMFFFCFVPMSPAQIFVKHPRCSATPHVLPDYISRPSLINRKVGILSILGWEICCDIEAHPLSRLNTVDTKI